MPLFATLLLASTTAGTAITAATRARRSRTTNQQANNDDVSLSGHVRQEVVSLPAEEEELNHYFGANSLGLGMTLGGLVFPPLMLASTPVSIYTSVPALREALRAWSQEKRLNSKTLESALVFGSLMTGNFLTAAAVGWTYSFGRKLKSQFRNDLRSLVEKTATSPQVWTEFNGSELQVPLDKVENGDIVIMRENSILPLSGRITKGEAMLNTYFSTFQTEPVNVKEGDMVPPLAIVISGQIHIQVMK